jgi:hypothetical protein
MWTKLDYNLKHLNYIKNTTNTSVLLTFLRRLPIIISLISLFIQNTYSLYVFYQDSLTK